MSFTPTPTLDAVVPTAQGLSQSRPEHLFVLGELITIRLPRTLSNGEVTVLEVVSPPGGAVPMHTHAGAETFMILDGEFELYGQVDGVTQTYSAPAGTVVHVPSQARHGYANVGSVPGRMMVTVHGEHQMEEFFRAIGVPVKDPSVLPVLDGPPDVEPLVRAMATYGVNFVDAPSFA